MQELLREMDDKSEHELGGGRRMNHTVNRNVDKIYALQRAA